MSQQIAKKYPTESHHILNLGKGMGILSQVMRIEMKEGKDFSDIPITGLKGISDIKSKRKVDKLLKKILPSVRQLKGKNLVLNRVLLAGHTMEVFLPYLLGYMKANNYPMPLKLNFYVPDKTWDWKTITESVERKSDVKMHIIEEQKYAKITENEINKDLKKDKGLFNYSKYSPFSVTRFLRPNFRIKGNKRYGKLKNLLRIHRKATKSCPKTMYESMTRSGKR